MAGLRFAPQGMPVLRYKGNLSSRSSLRGADGPNTPRLRRSEVERVDHNAMAWGVGNPVAWDSRYRGGSVVRRQTGSLCYFSRAWTLRRRSVGRARSRADGGGGGEGKIESRHNKPAAAEAAGGWRRRLKARCRAGDQGRLVEDEAGRGPTMSWSSTSSSRELATAISTILRWTASVGTQPRRVTRP